MTGLGSIVTGLGSAVIGLVGFWVLGFSISVISMTTELVDVVAGLISTAGHTHSTHTHHTHRERDRKNSHILRHYYDKNNTTAITQREEGREGESIHLFDCCMLGLMFVRGNKGICHQN